MKRNMEKIKQCKLYFGSLLFISSLLVACTTLKTNTSNPISLPAASAIVVGPVANYSDTPLANKQVESMLVGLMHAKGFRNVAVFPKKQACAKLLYCPEDMPSKAEIIRWARQNRVNFVLTGAANEWRYKVGLDGEPVAGVSLIIIDVQHGRTIWSGVGSVIGNSRQGLDVVGQKLLIEVTANVIPAG